MRGYPLSKLSPPLLVCSDLRREGHYKMMICVCPSVCRVPRPNSSTERSRKSEIDRMEACHTGNSEPI